MGSPLFRAVVVVAAGVDPGAADGAAAGVAVGVGAVAGFGADVGAAGDGALLELAQAIMNKTARDSPRTRRRDGELQGAVGSDFMRTLSFAPVP